MIISTVASFALVAIICLFAVAVLTTTVATIIGVSMLVNKLIAKIIGMFKSKPVVRRRRIVGERPTNNIQYTPITPVSKCTVEPTPVTVPTREQVCVQKRVAQGRAELEAFLIKTKEESVRLAKLRIQARKNVTTYRKEAQLQAQRSLVDTPVAVEPVKDTVTTITVVASPTSVQRGESNTVMKECVQEHVHLHDDSLPDVSDIFESYDF